MDFSPVEKIAKMIDFYFPYLIRNLLDIIENENYGLKIQKEEKDQHLIECFWAITKKENVYDLMFFFDYMLYINFFL